MRDERRVETDLGRMATFAMGEGPPAFLWPSLYVDHESLLPIVTELARTRRCILVDPPGHGQSAVPAARYTLDDCARAAGQILDAYEVEQVDWIGNAWGGHVGVLAALAMPARLRSLTIIGSPMTPLSRSMRLKSRLGWALLSLGARGLVGTLVAKAMVAPDAPAEHRDYVQRCVREAPAGGIPRAVQWVSLGRRDLTADLARITVPTLFIAGANDSMWSVDVASAEAARVPGGRIETVPGAAHLVPLEQPRATLEALARFLAALDERPEPSV